MKKAFVVGILILAFGCNSDNELKLYDFVPFTIEGPSSWKVRNVRGVDSYVKEIITENSDTLYFDYGYYSNPLEEEIHPVFDEFTIKLLTEKGVIEEDSLRAENQRAYEKAILNKKENFEFDTVGGFKAKLVKPIKIGEGVTGIYFDSLRNSSSMEMTVKLNFYGIDLNEQDQNDVLRAVKTIKFKK